MAINYTESKITIAVPDELVKFMADVFSRIEAKDDSALLPSDDLLQGDGGYGGLLPDGKRYSFVFFPEEGTRVSWEFTLLADEIDEIGSGWRKEMVVRRIEKTDQ